MFNRVDIEAPSMARKSGSSFANDDEGRPEQGMGTVEFVECVISASIERRSACDSVTLCDGVLYSFLRMNFLYGIRVGKAVTSVTASHLFSLSPSPQGYPI